VKRKLAAAAAVLIAGLGAAIFLRSDTPPPPGFRSIREASAFQDPALLERAWALPVAKLYPRPLVSQSNPSSCGPASVSNALTSAGLTRSADEIAAHGAGCLAGLCFGGLTLTQLADATRASAEGFTVTELRPANADAFREVLRQAANDPQRRLLINFHRKPLFGTGGGHHSPIGGYLEAEDLVLVLDVNERFGPWLVSSERLFEAMDTVDSSSGAKRGLLELVRP
jgi:hypothetical protein